MGILDQCTQSMRAPVDCLLAQTTQTSPIALDLCCLFFQRDDTGSNRSKMGHVSIDVCSIYPQMYPRIPETSLVGMEGVIADCLLRSTEIAPSKLTAFLHVVSERSGGSVDRIKQGC